MYTPSLPVFRLRSCPVSMLRITMSAPGTTAPFASLTVPWRVPVTVCAAVVSGMANSNTAQRITKNEKRFGVRSGMASSCYRLIRDAFVGAALRGRPTYPQITYLAKNGVATEGHPYKTSRRFISGAAESDARTSLSHLIVFQNRRAIYKHVADTKWKLVRPIERSLIDDRVFIEDHDVSRKAFANQPAIAKTKRLRGQRSHLPDRILERNQFQLTNVATEHTRVVAVPTRMGNTVINLPHTGV